MASESDFIVLLPQNGTLQVLSRKDGETIMSMVPSNDEVSSAAGTAASVELSEASAEDMTEAESSAFIVRLHEENGTVTAAQLSQASDAESLPFKSGLFSTYAIVSASNGTSGKCGDNLTWKIDANGNLTITGTGAMYDYSVVEGATTAPWGDAVTSITIGDKVTSIGDNAFYKCTGLKEVEIPESVTGIGEGAFFGCSALEKATIPASVTSIGEDAFASCPKLTIYCYWDSKALAYAKANKIPYVIIGETPTTAPTVVPKTGDNAFPALWIGLVILGIIGMGAAVLLRRNRK